MSQRTGAGSAASACVPSLATEARGRAAIAGQGLEPLYRTLGESIAIESVFSSGLWRSFADPNQLENAILNLAVNARDAFIPPRAA